MSERLILTTKLLCLSAALLVTSPAFSGEWESLPPLPEPNGGFVSGSHHGAIYVIGGTNWRDGTKHWLDAVRSFDPSTMKWTQHEVRQRAAYAVETDWTLGKPDHSLVWIGGFDGTTNLKSYFDLSGESAITRSSLSLPESVVLAAGGRLGDKFVIVGGTTDPANVAGFVRTATMIEVPLKTKSLPDYPGKAFGTAASAVVGDELFVFGGGNWDAAANAVVNASEAHAFSVNQNAWRKLKPLPYAARGMTAVAIDDHRIYIGGGFKTDPEGFTTEALIYDTGTDRYSTAKPLPYAAMVALVTLDGSVYCLGGEDKMKHRTDKFFRITVAELLK